MHALRQPVRTPLTRVIVIILVALGAPAAWSEERDIVARVNGEPVTRQDLQRFLADPTLRRRLQEEIGVPEPDGKELERRALGRIIHRRLLLQEAGRRSFTVSEQEVNRHAGKFRHHFKNPRRYAAWMRARGLDEKSLRDGIRANLLAARVQAALVDGLRLTEEQVQAYYAANREQWKTGEETKSLAEVRPEIERRLLSAKQEEAVRAWLAEEEKTSKIEVFLTRIGEQGSEARYQGTKAGDRLAAPLAPHDDEVIALDTGSR